MDFLPSKLSYENIHKGCLHCLKKPFSMQKKNDIDPNILPPAKDHKPSFTQTLVNTQQRSLIRKATICGQKENYVLAHYRNLCKVFKKSCTCVKS